MLDIMYEIPSKNNVKEVVIDENVINDGGSPMLVYKTEDEMRAEDEAKKKAGTGNQESA
ncbi:ATP-dependent protease ATP-binding subunit ClpX [compost metagenome]